MVNDDQNEDQRHSTETDGSRRTFLASSAGALGTLALGGAFGAQSVGADHHEADDEGMEGGGATEEMFEDDVAILNYALTLEYLEAAFYQRALENLDKDDVISEDVEELAYLTELPEPTQERIYEKLTVIQEHEQTHVEALSSIITDLGEEPVEEPEFDFGTAVEDPVEFIQTAAVLEDTGVGAYAGAAPFIEDESLVPPALSIHSVEGRHASFVRELGSEIGFPNAFDESLSKATVLDAASQFIVSGGDDSEGGETMGNETESGETMGNESETTES